MAFFSRRIPSAVTRTQPSCVVSSSRVTVRAAPVQRTVCLLYPIQEMTMSEPDLTPLIEKCPFKSVNVPLLFAWPLTKIEAPMMGSPFESRTTPVRAPLRSWLCATAVSTVLAEAFSRASPGSERPTRSTLQTVFIRFIGLYLVSDKRCCKGRNSLHTTMD